MGEEELLRARAVSAVRAAVFAHHEDAEEHELAAAGLPIGQLADVLAPSLFGEHRLVVVTGVQESAAALADSLVGYAKDPDPEMTVIQAKSLRHTFRDGFVVNLLNPKTAIFFLSFLPQFVDPARGPVHSQILVFGLTFMGLGILSDGMFALAAGAAGGFLRRSEGIQRMLRWFSGMSFVGLGVTAALASRK